MSAQRVLITGSNGLLGQKLTELLIRGSSFQIMLASRAPKPVRQLYTAEYTQLDVTSKKDVKHLVSSFDPDLIINTAALTNVDACENERELAWKVNVEGVENLIDAAKVRERRIVHISTDYVFDGREGPYAEEDRPEPLSYYGKTKLASENALRTSDVPHMIVRTIVLYGYAPGSRPNFALWLIENLEKKLPVRIVDDQHANPTLVDDLAYAVVSGIELGRSGIYHVAGRDIISRYEFARKLARVFDFDESLITPVKTSQLRQPAPRPLKSGLITLKAEVELGYRPSTADDGLAVLKSQLMRTARWLSDSPPVQSGKADKQQSDDHA